MAKTIKEDTSPELQAVLENQKSKAAVEKQIEQLRASIQEAEAQAQLLSPMDDEIAALKIKREDLLADIATGKDKSQALSELDAILEEKQKNLADQENVRTSIRQTVAGLNRKLASANSELVGLQQTHHELVQKLVRASAEHLGEQYVAAAQQLKSIYDQLMGICLVSEEKVSRTPLHALKIPVFGLDSVRSCAMKWDERLLVDSSIQTYDQHLAMRDEKKSTLRAMGVEL